MSVKRWESDFEGDMEEYENGRFVLHSDYVALSAQAGELVKVIEQGEAKGAWECKCSKIGIELYTCYIHRALAAFRERGE